MRAARYYGIEDVRIEDVETPLPGHGEVQVRVSFNGICGSDLHEYYDGPRSVPMTPHPLTGVRAPVILGHEAAGVVSGVGGGVDGVAEGDLVVIEPLHACHRCVHCLVGHPNFCEVLAFHGYATGGGGLAEYTVVPHDMVHRTPAGITERQAAVIEPLAVAHHAVARWGMLPEATAAVFGGGPIGIGILLDLQAHGVHDVIVVEPAEDRRTIASGLGARTVDPTEHDPGDQIRAMTGGRGVRVAFETAGAATSFGSAVGSVAKQGTVVLVTSGRHRVEAPLGRIISSEIAIQSSYAYAGDDFPQVIALMAAGAYPTDSWTDTTPLDGLIGAFERLHRGEGMKTLIDPRPC